MYSLKDISSFKMKCVKLSDVWNYKASDKWLKQEEFSAKLLLTSPTFAYKGNKFLKVIIQFSFFMFQNKLKYS